ncbi:uncharacterized protein LOC142322025 [Lycorma delicatula]|uniref:uncharacterized protein LOC142322025 n=1 Tax=Lycorma delicatula TaxID=130591 RepID=UPI003F50E771
MLAEAGGWIATGVGAPVVAVVLCWAILVLHCDRSRWRPSDPLLVALLGESALHQVAACTHTVLALLRPEGEIWCSGLAWLLHAVRTMQAGTLTSLALGRFLRHRPLLLYHIACLTVLSSCVGVAAVLARSQACESESDRRYVVFWLGLHGVLLLTSILALVSSCCRGVEIENTIHSTGNQRRQLLNSSSDLSSALSDISMISTMRSRSGRGISHSVSDCSARTRNCLVEELLRISPVSSGNSPPITYLNSAPDTSRLHYSSSFLSRDEADYGLPEPCYVSTTNSASSTNSRAPCLSRRSQQQLPLSTLLSVLTLCYVINHVPVLVLSIFTNFFPDLIPKEWPLDCIPLWSALLEGALLPLVLALSDKMFQRRVAAIYTRHRPSDISKPLQGLHGKFRPFNNSLLDCQRPATETVRFPITNGSLFTSLDGRIPIIHHYRRCKGVRTSALSPYCLNANLAQRYPQSVNPSDAASQLHANIIAAEINKSESALTPFVTQKDDRLSGQCLTQRLSTADLRQEPDPFPQNIQQLRESLYLDSRDSDEEFEVDSTEEPLYATLSSRSVCSATTAANDDFEFYQQDDELKMRRDFLSDTRIMSRCSSVDGVSSSRENEIIRRKSSSSGTLESQSSSRPTYRQQPPPARRPRLGPLTRRLGLPPTPPPPRRLAPVLSVDSLVAALHQADVSYLDTGDLYRHTERAGSVPDLKKVFYTGFL